MIKRKKLTLSQVRKAIQATEFDAEITGSNKRVAVVMTQGWCPQWTMMQDWLTDLEDPGNLDIYEYVYDKSELFHEFLELKESVWRNSQIPYVRYYRNGKLMKESNYASADRFMANLGD